VLVRADLFAKCGRSVCSCGALHGQPLSFMRDCVHGQEVTSLRIGIARLPAGWDVGAQGGASRLASSLGRESSMI